jgi:hypothetical protein
MLPQLWDGNITSDSINYGIYLSGHPVPPEAISEPRDLRDSLAARTVLRPAWQSVASNWTVSWL